MRAVLRALQPRASSLGHRAPHTGLGPLRERESDPTPTRSRPRCRLCCPPRAVLQQGADTAQASRCRVDQQTTRRRGRSEEYLITCLIGLDRFRSRSRHVRCSWSGRSCRFVAVVVCYGEDGPVPLRVGSKSSPWLRASMLAVFCLFSEMMPAPSGAEVESKPLPSFVATRSAVSAATVRFTWHAGCPVGSSSLELLRLSYVGFDHRAHRGSIIVNKAVVAPVIAIFSRLYSERFPIESMEPEDAFHGSDPASMAADNTSGFNCRYAVAPGPPQWSVHAYGEAIDVNPVQNPYIEDGKVQPSTGKAFLNRADIRPGMATPNGDLVGAFHSQGWYWGGRWQNSPDYQHFSLTGG